MIFALNQLTRSVWLLVYFDNCLLLVVFDYELDFPNKFNNFLETKTLYLYYIYTG